MSGAGDPGSNDNLPLFDTIKHFVSLQEELVKLRAITDTESAYSLIYNVLCRYIQVRRFEIFVDETGGRANREPAFKLDFQRPVDAGGDSTLFDAAAIQDVVTQQKPIIRDLAEDPAVHSPQAQTAILNPLIFQGKTIGYVVVEIQSPVGDIMGLPLEVADWLIRDLSSFVGNKRLSARIQHVASLNRSIIESVRHGVVAVDSSGTILCANPAARLVLSPNAEGRPCEEALAASLVPVAQEVIQSEGQDRAVEFSARDGRVIPLLVSATPLESGAPEGKGWVLMFQDTSLSVEVENLTQLDRLKSEFFSGLIHDMKTPITGIVSGCDLLTGSDPDIPEEFSDVLRIIHASAERLQSLVLDILDMSSLKSTAVDEKLESADIVELLNRTLDPIMLQASNHRIHVEHPDEPIFLFCQPRCITRVIENLVGNAIKYSPYGGDIWVGTQTRDNMAEIVVRDEGLGIKKSELAAIWEPFRRARNQLNTIEGTGLGLSIIKMVVDKHRGRVNVDSEYGKGSTFTVQLPMITAPQPAAAAVAE